MQRGFPCIYLRREKLIGKGVKDYTWRRIAPSDSLCPFSGEGLHGVYL